MRLKHFLSVFLTLLTLSVGQMWGADPSVTISVSSDSWTSTGTSGSGGTTSVTKSGITVSSTKGYKDGTNHIRDYQNSVITISSSVGNIKSIAFTCTASGTSNNGPSKLSKNNAQDAGSYSYSQYVGTWSFGTGTSNVSSVQLKATAQCRWTQVVVTYVGSDCSKPTVGSSLSSVSSTENSITATVPISATGGCNITENGLVYSTTASTPTVGGSGCIKETVTACGATAANKSVTISGLNCGTNYYVRGYATNSSGTSYTNVTTRSTSDCPKYTVTLMDDDTELEQATAGASITLPSRDGCTGYTFAGWTKSWTEEQDEWTTTAPDIIDAGSYTPQADENLYPVYTKTEGASGTKSATLYYEPFGGSANSTAVQSTNVAATTDMFTDPNATVWSHYTFNAASTTSYATNLDGDKMSNGTKILKQTNNTTVTMMEVTGIKITNATNLSLSLYNRRTYTSASLKISYKIDNGSYTAVGGTIAYNNTNDNWKLSDGLTISGTGNSLALKIELVVSGTTNRTMLLDDIKVTGQIPNATTYYISDPNCCTSLGSINGSVNWSSPTEVVLSWNKLEDQVTSWGNVTYGVSGSVACAVDTEDDTKMKCTISGLDCGTAYTFTLHPTLKTDVCALAADPTIVSTSPKYNVTYSLSGVALASGEGIQEEGESALCGDFLAMYEPTSGAFALPDDITVKIGEATLDPSNYTWDTNDGTLMIDAQYITDHVTVTITGESVGCNAPAVLGTPTLTSITDGVITVNCPSISAGTSCAINDYGFIWKKDDAPESLSDNQNQVGTNDQSAAFAKAISIAFETGTTYNFKAYGTNGKGTYYSSNLAVKPQSVTFDSKGGSEVATAFVNCSTVVAQPADPTKLGYDFAGWTLGGSAYSFSSEVTGNITLDATWTNHDYTVTNTLEHCSASIPSSYTYTGSADDFTYTITADDKYVLPATITVTMGGNALTVNTDYTWDNATGELAISKVIAGDLAITVTAQRVYSVTLKDKNEVLTQASAGANVTLPTRKSCEGYAFQGWTASWVAEQSSWTSTAPASIIPAGSYGASLDGDIDLYPVYKKTDQVQGFISYTIVDTDQNDWSGKYLLSTGTETANGTFDNNGHLLKVDFAPNTENANYEFTLAKVGTVGYSIQTPSGEYLGWTTGGGTSFSQETTEPTSSTTYYLWTPSTTGYTTNVGSGRQIAYNGSADFRPYSSPSTGATYLYKRNEGLQNVDKYISVSECCEDLDYIKGSVTATTQTSATLEWNKLSHVESNPYSLSYKVHGSSAEPTAFEGTIDVSGAKATCTVSNLACGTEYDFILHIDAVSGYCDTDSTITGTTGKYAVTKADATNGSFTTSVAEACEGTSITLSATPASENYEFTRWTIKKTSDLSDDITSDVSLVSVGNASTSFTMPAFGVTVIATFDVKKAKYDITLDANEGQSAGAGTITEGGNMMSIVTTPSRVGHTIAGYYTLAVGGDMVADATGTLQASVEGWTDGDGNFTKNAAGTLYTHWSVQSFTLAWNTNGGSELAGDYTSGSVNYGATLTAPTDPTLTGYHFVKWNSAEDGNGVDYNGSMPAANTTYYAQWAIENYTVTWLNNGDPYAPSTPGTANADYNTTISTIPSPNPSNAPTQCSDKVFMGWTKVDIDGVSETNPGNIFTRAEDAPKITENTTFHAVWADKVSGVYELVTSESTALANGDKIIIVNSGEAGNAFAIGEQNKNNRAQESVSIDADLKIEPDLAATTDDEKVYQFQLVTNGNYFNIKDVVADLYLAGSGDNSNNYLKTQSSGTDDKTKFTITIDEESNAATIEANYSGRNKLQYNSGNSIFACYGSGQTPVYIYRELTLYENYITACCKSAPAVGVASSSNVGATTATVTCAAGATIGSKGCSIEEYGFVVGPASNPTIGGANVTKYALPLEDFVAEASFSKGLSNLSGTYYVRPFATNAIGTTYGTQTSFATVEVTSIDVKAGHGATQTEYVNGESFNGEGLIIVEHLNNGQDNEVTYENHEGSFSFTPSPLTTGTTSVTISCSEKNTTQNVTVYAVNDIVIQDEDGTELSGEGKPTASRSGATLSTSAGTEKYVFKEWQVTNASVENNKIVNPTGEVSITAVYWKPRVVTWKNNNGVHATTYVAYNTKPEFPATPTSDDATSTSFVGWSTATWTGKIANMPNTVYTNADDMSEITDETTEYHAVFGKLEPEKWAQATLASLTSSDIFVIVETTANHALYNGNGTSSAPTATSITIADNKITSVVTDNLKWNVSGNATDGFTFYPNGSTNTWLYCTNTNNGVRVGPGDAKHFTINSGYLYTTETEKARYIGVYNNADWRCYDNTEGNIAYQEFAYFKRIAAYMMDYMTTKTYTVTCEVASGSTGYGTVDPSSITNVLKGTSISASGNVLTIGETAVTATPTEMTAQYEYAFDSWAWTPNVEEVGNADITATATFTRSVRSYAITATLTNVTANVDFPANRDYGSSFSCTITAGGDYVLPAEISVTGATYNWNRETGALNITEVQGPVSISISGVGAYKLKFVEEDNTEINVIKVATGEEYTHTITEVPNNIPDGFEFAGRWTDGTTIYTGSITVSEAKTLKPCWKKTTTEDTDVDDLPASVTDIVVANEKELAIDADRNLESLVVKAGGSVTFDENESYGLTVQNLTIESEAGKSGQVTDGEKITVNGDIYMDVTFFKGATTLNATTAGRWYMISAPFDVNLSDGFTLTDGTAMRFGVDDNLYTFDLFEYDGKKRGETGVTGWKRVQGKMKAGTACLIGFNPGQPTTIRLKAASAVGEPESIELKAFTGDSYNQNWNGVANPTLHYTNISHDVQTYNNEDGENGRKYIGYSHSSTSFVVGTAFFVQETGTMTLSPVTTPGTLRAPKRESERYEACVQIFRQEATEFADQMYVRASETASSEYEQGHDMITWNGTTANTAMIWAENYGKRLAIEEAPLVSNQASYALGIFAPKAGTYRIAATSEDDADLYLTYEGSIIWNLSMGEYEIDLEKGTTNGYGLLLQAKAPQVVTGVDEVDAETGVQKIIIDEHVFILRGGQMYDVTGKMVK